MDQDLVSWREIQAFFGANDRSSPTPPAATASHWCYSCDRFVRAAAAASVGNAGVVCPVCDGRFLEEMDAPTPRRQSGRRRRRSTPWNPPHWRCPLGGSSSSYNQDIVLPPYAEVTATGGGATSAGSWPRLPPDSMSDLLLTGSGFQRLLDQLAQMEAGRPCDDYPPASRAAVESMPTVVIAARHVGHDCAVCKEAFELGAEAREMPCGHMYHHDCILPWLALRNSCPVCRHQLPTDAAPATDDQGSSMGAEAGSEEAETTVGLTIWRLPGGGFAVGRFAGGSSRAGDRGLPVVYTEVDGGFNNGGAPRMISWSSRRNRSSDRGILRRVLHSMFACFGHAHSTTNARASSSRSEWSSVFSRGFRSRSTSWTSQDDHADAIAR